jgi:isocitrate/isopropylmalate dehydrogenase
VGQGALATRIRNAIEATLREQKTVTRDVGGSANTAAYTDAVIARL